MPIALGTTLLSNRFILLVFKPEFLPAAHALCIIIWVLIFSSDNLIFANVLVASNNQKINLIGNLISVISNILLNFLLIPKFGFIGASIANLLSSIIMFIYQYYYISKELLRIDYFQQIKKPFIASIIMGIVIFLIRGTSLFIIIPMAVIVYSLSLVFLKTFTEKDRNLFRQLLVGKVGLGANTKLDVGV
jgi:O-antigen/teichoic acid export membrane protein